MQRVRVTEGEAWTSVDGENATGEMRAGISKAIRHVFGDVDVDETAGGVRFRMPHPSEITDPSLRDARVLRDEARKLFSSKGPAPAIAKCKDGVKLLVDGRSANDIKLPLFTTPSADTSRLGKDGEGYIDVNVWRRIALMGCCNDVASYYLRSGNDIEALSWLEESDVLYNSTCTQDKKPQFDWMAVNLSNQDYFAERMNTLSTLSDIFLRLGNTGIGVSRKWAAQALLQTVPPALDKKPLETISNTDILHDIASLKHPDAKLSLKLELKNPDLQIMGSWQKIEIPRSGAIQPRMGFSSFVWNSRFYVLGGEKAIEGPYFHDLRYIDLNDTNRGWQALSSYPFNQDPFIRNPNCNTTGWKIRLHERDQKAYIFTGRSAVDYFDLKTETWGSIKTKWSSEGGLRSWPFPDSDLTDFAMELAGDKIYIFGGSHSTCGLGCSLFMALDLPTRTWRRLSGCAGTPTSPLKPEWTCPGPRKHPIIWVDEKQNWIFVMFGEADRLSASFSNEGLSGAHGYGYDDCWSWDIQEGWWRQERLHGNPPCPRSEMTCTYNPKLHKVIAFGGYSPSIPCVAPETNEYFAYSYYADTFVYSPSTGGSDQGTWKQVLTRGFPTYRAQARIFSDPATGKVFLFGGYTNSQFVRDRKYAVSRTFADLWWLKLAITDAKGASVGFFEGVDLEEESRTAKVGPWQRCFNCGSAGPWKKCGGTCKGKAFFCDSQCLKEGWREHKERHHCRK